jgi:hypothetical protein
MDSGRHERRQGLEVNFNLGSLLEDLAELGFHLGHGRVASRAFFGFGFRTIVVVRAVGVVMVLHQRYFELVFTGQVCCGSGEDGGLRMG